MRHIDAEIITEKVKELFSTAAFELGPDLVSAIKEARIKEESPVGVDILEKLIQNAEMAREQNIPICQDTGMATVFLELGQDLHITGGLLNDAVNRGVRLAYEESYLRKSVCHPLTRKNTGDNTPAILHLDIVAGDRLKIITMPKGGGSENMSGLYMLPPSAGWEGVKAKVVETVSNAGPNPCPPLIIGIALGSSFDKVSIEAKKTLLRPLNQKNSDPDLAEKEAELLTAINNLGVGPSGLGGRITALAVHLAVLPCHIASLPLAVNLQCHASRHAEAIL